MKKVETEGTLHKTILALLREKYSLHYVWVLMINWLILNGCQPV